MVIENETHIKEMNTDKRLIENEHKEKTDRIRANLTGKLMKNKNDI